MEKVTERPIHLAILQGSSRDVLKKLALAKNYLYWPLLNELKLVDVVQAAFRTGRSILFSGRFTSHFQPLAGIDLSPVLKEALQWDLGRGGYFYNQLVYYAAKRYGERTSPSILIYPFEMKSLEKMLLIGIREGSPKCSIVGYQHTSITKRHTTFMLAPRECESVPLPDFVVTVGDITQRHLSEKGRYPTGFFRVGAAFRQSQRPLSRGSHAIGRELRLLLALSSSRRELIEAVNMLCNLVNVRNDILIGVRPHPEFPLSLLPSRLRDSLNDRFQDFTETSLTENLEWCDAVIYISSTVALESLMVGKPVINLRISDSIDPDPLLGDPPLRYKVRSKEEMIHVCDELRKWLLRDNLSDQMAASSYVQNYLRPPTSRDIDAFFELAYPEGHVQLQVRNLEDES